MSGGVDSSAAAHLLRAAGHEVIGIFMRHGQTLEMACATPTSQTGGSIARLQPSAEKGFTSKPSRDCFCSILIISKVAVRQADAADARRVADKLDIPFYALDFTDAFNDIIDYFVSEYSIARTPNPCIMCNNWIKFGRLFAYADSVSADYVATGHYARLAMDYVPTQDDDNFGFQAAVGPAAPARTG